MTPFKTSAYAYVITRKPGLSLEAIGLFTLVAARLSFDHNVGGRFIEDYLSDFSVETWMPCAFELVIARLWDVETTPSGNVWSVLGWDCYCGGGV